MSPGLPWVLSILLYFATALSCPDRRVLGTRRVWAAVTSNTSALSAEPDRGSSRSWASLAGQRFQAVRDVPYRTIGALA
jgi:hypothetical protein